MSNAINFSYRCLKGLSPFRTKRSRKQDDLNAMDENVNFSYTIGLLKYKLLSFLVITCCLLVSCNGSEEITLDVQWTSSIKLTEYKGYQSVNLVSFSIPDATIEAVWDIQTATSRKSCPSKYAQVYFQQGSYPLVTPYNETYPSNFYLNRTDLHHVQVPSNNISYFKRIPSPKPGYWFMASFLPKSKEKIKQKGLSGKSCGYGMGVRFISKVITNMEDISLSKHHRIHLVAPTVTKFYRLLSSDVITSYTLKVQQCSLKYENRVINMTFCPVVLTTSAEHLPISNFDRTVNCSEVVDGSPCQLTMDMPSQNMLNYLRVDIAEDINYSSIEFHIDVSFLKCQLKFHVIESKKRKKGLDINSSDALKHVLQYYQPQNYTNDTDSALHFISVKSKDSSQTLVNYTINPVGVDRRKLKSQESCILLPFLGSLRLASEDFTAIYLLPDVLLYPQPENRIFVPDEIVLISSFTIKPIIDSGGTLRIKLSSVPDHGDPSQTAVVWLCLMKNVMPGKHLVHDDCKGGISLSVNTSDSAHKSSDTLYIPYPEDAVWYIGLNSICFSKNDSREPESCLQFPFVSMEVMMTKCVDNQCGKYGACQEYISGLHVFSSCSCFAGWRGYGCTDGTEAESDSSLLLTALLLTLSNILFIPGIVVALYRRYFVEAFIYFFTMFFSTFYHACDTNDTTHHYCIMKYDVLSFCDFLGSIMSFWVTILAMARLSKPVRSFFHMLGALCLSLGVEYDRHGLWVFVVPAATGVAIMAISWFRQCYVRKKLYPSKWRYIKFLLPGVIFAGTGLVIFAFLETEDNYRYTHSAWHMVMALAIVFLLPSRPNTKDPKPYMQLEPRGPETVRLLDDYSDDDDIMISDVSLVSPRNVVL